jgi:hypothetical protein
MDTYDYEEELHEFAQEIPGRFILTAEELNRKVYEAFLAYRQQIDPPYEYEALLKKSEQLFDRRIPLPDKQTILAQLSQCDTVEAYRLIERYTHHPESALEQWSKIALYECRMRLEQTLLDKPIGLISTGLGGEGHRIRYLVVLGYRKHPPSEDSHHIERIWQSVCQRHDSVLESLQHHPSYVTAHILVSMDVAVGTVIEESIVLMNHEDNQIYQDYLVTNVSEPTDEDIQTFLDDIAKA